MSLDRGLISEAVGPLSAREAVEATPRSPDVFVRLAPARTTAVFESYWRFAAERQKVYFRRLGGQEPPWTQDLTLQGYRFTNAYRAADRVSQYLIRNVIETSQEQSVEDAFFRVVLFKIFNRIETWELIRDELGEPRWTDFDSGSCADVLSRARGRGERIYSAAYIMPPGNLGASEKHRNHLKLLGMMMADRLPDRISESRSMKGVFELLLEYPTVGPFLGFQLAIDLNYSSLTDFSEMEFVVPGPGAIDGIRKCFSETGGLNESDLIRLVTDRQHEEFDRLGIEFEDLWGRPLQLIDCQNLFCEVDKYARVVHPEYTGKSGRTRIKQRYRAAGPLPTPMFPAKWGLDPN